MNKQINKFKNSSERNLIKSKIKLYTVVARLAFIIGILSLGSIFFGIYEVLILLPVGMILSIYYLKKQEKYILMYSMKYTQVELSNFLNENFNIK